MPWFAVHTKPNSEAYADTFLRYFGAATYLPRVLIRRCHAGKVSQVARPFIPRYLFVEQNTIAFPRMRYAPGVSAVVGGAEGDPALVSDAVVDEVRSREVGGYVLLDDEVEPGVAPPKVYHKGQEIRVQRGALFATGLFQHRTGEERALVFLRAMGRLTRAVVAVADLEAA